MTARTNTAEGGTPGANLAAGQTGSGDAFDALGGGGSCVYSNAWSAHGTQSYLVNEPTAQKYAAYTGYNAATGAGRQTVYLNAAVTQAQDILVLLNSAGGSVKVQLTTTGQLRVVAASGSSVKTFTALSTLTGYRVELYAAKGTTTSNGTIKCAYYLGDSLTPVETPYEVTGAVNAGTTNFTGGRFMKNTASVALNAHFDDICYSDTATDYIGPYARTGLTGTSNLTLTGVGTVGSKGATGLTGTSNLTLTGVGTVGSKGGVGLPGVSSLQLSGFGSVGSKAASGLPGVGGFTLTGDGPAGTKGATGSGVGSLSLSGDGSPGTKATDGQPGVGQLSLTGGGTVGLKTVIGPPGVGGFTVSGFGAAGTKAAEGQPGYSLLTLIGYGEPGSRTVDAPTEIVDGGLAYGRPPVGAVAYGRPPVGGVAYPDPIDGGRRY